MRLHLPYLAAVAALAALPASAQTFLGPTPYLGTADSPFPLGSPSFVLETFEDHLLDAPGVSASTGYVTSTHFSGSIIDSVDADDGVLGNNACSGCDSYFGSGSVTFQFSAAALGGLPQRVGIVWTDGGTGCTVTFQAFGAGNVSLGTVVAPNLGDGSNTGTTGEDRFFGIDYAGGVAAIKVTNSSGGLELDHLQYELPCGVSASSIYCTSKTNSLGCLPLIGFQGCPSASSGAPFEIVCSQVVAAQSGILFYGYGPSSAPFQGGFMCVQSPIQRTPIQNAGGAPGSCAGHFSFDVNAWIQSGNDPSLAVGATACAQYWYRDPASPSTTGLSDALSFVVKP